MNRISVLFAMLVSTVSIMAQGNVKGKILDKQSDEALQFVTIRVTDANGKLAGGGMTDVKGLFHVQSLKDGAYTLEVSMMGYKTATRRFQISPDKRTVHYGAIYLSEDQKMLKEVQVTGQRSQMKLQSDTNTRSFVVGWKLCGSTPLSISHVISTPSVSPTMFRVQS